MREPTRWLRPRWWWLPLLAALATAGDALDGDIRATTWWAVGTAMVATLAFRRSRHTAGSWSTKPAGRGSTEIGSLPTVAE